LNNVAVDLAAVEMLDSILRICLGLEFYVGSTDRQVHLGVLFQIHLGDSAVMAEYFLQMTGNHVPRQIFGNDSFDLWTGRSGTGFLWWW